MGSRKIVPQCDTMKLSGTHRKTLRAVFDGPVRSDIAWIGIEKLLVALGAELSEGRGSRARIHLNQTRAVFDRPPPRNETESPGERARVLTSGFRKSWRG